jgi:3-oxoacyl-[acyl-carrier-protein] synthase I
VIYLSDAGLVCSVGLNASAACAAMRAGVSNLTELPYWDSNNLPVVGATIPSLNLDLQFGPRLVEMLARALSDCLSGSSEWPLEKVPLLVGLAEPGRPGAGGQLVKCIIEQVQEKLKVKFHPSLSQAIPMGHTAGFQGLRIARELLQTSDIPGCLVCGVDSYINASSLFWLDKNWRLKRINHTDGIIPGEAAAVIYVQRQVSSKTEARVEVVGLGFAHEKATIFSEEPLLALGLANAGRQALAEAGFGFHQLDFRLSDVTGENYGFREHALMEGRLARVVRKEPQPLWHAADSIGDTGAAAGVVQLVRATEAWAKRYAPGTRAACFASALSEDRAVALLHCSDV